MNQEKNGFPEKVGRYILVKQIAKGGMSKIYLGTDEIIGRSVAVKLTWTLDPSWKNMKPSDIIRLFNVEVQISGQLSHHNFVTIYDAGLQEDYGYLVMELMEGRPISDIIKANYRELDIRGKLEVLVQIARALYYAHQNGIIHRDIKPSNIMLLNNGHIKILDFGVAYVSEGSSIKLGKQTVQLPGVGGTPYYMSPEQVSKKKLDGRSDLFSLSVMAYELFTGKRPFEASNVNQLYQKILNFEPDPISKVDPTISEKISSVIQNGMTKSIEQRIPDCQTFANALDTILNEENVGNSSEEISKNTLATIQKYRESFEFFFDLDNSQVYEILKLCKIKKYMKDDIIVKENEVARDVYLVMSGRVRIVRDLAGRPYMLNILTRGDLFGEMGIIDGRPRSASAIADDDSLCLTLHQVALLKCSPGTTSRIYKNIATMLSKRLRQSSDTIDELILKNIQTTQLGKS